MSIRFVCSELFLLKYARVCFVARYISKTKKNFNFKSKFGETSFVLKSIKIVLKRTVVPIFLPCHVLARESFFFERNI